MYKEKNINKLPPQIKTAFVNFEQLNPGCDLFDFQRFLIQEIENIYIDKDKILLNIFGVENFRIQHDLIRKIINVLGHRESYNSNLMEIYLITLMQNYILTNRKKFSSWKQYKSEEIDIDESLTLIKFFVTLVRWYNNKVFINQQEASDYMISIIDTIKTQKFSNNTESLVFDLFKLAQKNDLKNLTQLLQLYYLPNSSKSQKLQFLTQALLQVSHYRLESHKKGITTTANFNKISNIAYELTQNIAKLTEEAKNYDIELSQLCTKYSNTDFIMEMKSKLPKTCYESLFLHSTCYSIIKADSTIPQIGLIQLDESFKMIINYLLEYEAKKEILDYKLQLIKNNNDLIYNLSVMFKNLPNIQSETLITNKFYDLNFNSIKLIKEFNL